MTTFVHTTEQTFIYYLEEEFHLSMELVSFVTPVAVWHVLQPSHPTFPCSLDSKEGMYLMHAVFCFCKESAFKMKSTFLKKMCCEGC